MSIVNRRNALLGWGVWKLAKRAVRRRMQRVSGRTKVAMAGGATAAAAGAVVARRSLG